MARRRRTLVLSLSALAVYACSSRFDPASKIVSLRVLAVQKDKPYARPGDTVKLRMLLADGAAFADAGRKDVTITWLTGCVNPDGDSYINCFKPLLEKGANIADALSLFQPSYGVEASLTLPPRDQKDKSGIPFIHRGSSPGQPPYGTAFVFFVACTGFLDAVKVPNGLPFACFDKQTRKQLGADQFVAGYTEVFAYDDITNANPVVKGLRVTSCSPLADGGQSCKTANVVPDCIGEACVALEQQELGISSDTGGSAGVEAGAPGPVDAAGSGRTDAEAPSGSLDAAAPGSFADASTGAGGTVSGNGGAGGAASSTGGMAGSSTGGATPAPPQIECTGTSTAPACFDVCTDDDQDKCPKVIVDIDMDAKANNEADAVQESIEHHTINEQMWVNYYSDAGKYVHDVKLLQDATSGWNDAHSADLRTPREIGRFHVWAVAHDNRGGTEWVRVTLATRPPKDGYP